jgi:hypothetical protein
MLMMQLMNFAFFCINGKPSAEQFHTSRGLT